MNDIELADELALLLSACRSSEGKWDSGQAGNANLVAFNGEDIVGIGHVPSPLRRNLICTLRNNAPQIIEALRRAPREANDDDARDAARWRAIEWRWGSGTVTLDCDDKGFFRMQVEHAEANDEYITALDPEGVLAKAITAEEASSREYVGEGPK